MPQFNREAEVRAALAGIPPEPTDGQVIREAMSRLVPIAVSDIAGRWRKCPERRCRREQCCMAPQMECIAAPRLAIANIETVHAWLAKRLRDELVDILLARTLGAEEAEHETHGKPQQPADTRVARG
jgi:hypothetical protein